MHGSSGSSVSGLTGIGLFLQGERDVSICYGEMLKDVVPINNHTVISVYDAQFRLHCSGKIKDD